MDPYAALRKSYDTDLLILRTLFALNPDTNLPISTNYIVSTDGIGGLVWQGPYDLLSTVGPGVGYLPSTIQDLRTNLSSLSSFVSTLDLNLQVGLSTLSTTLGLAYISSGIYNFQLTSTVAALASVGYISSSQLQSTVEGLGSATYVSTSQLQSTVAWFQDPSRFVSTGALVSTTAAFVSNPSFISTTIGLGSAGYVSTLSLYSSIQRLSTDVYSTFQQFSTLAFTLIPSSFQSTVAGLGTAGYLSSPQLISTVEGLGSASYISTASLVSTVSWMLDPSRYVSTGALVSTAAGISTNLQTSWYIDNGQLTINSGTVYISSAATVIYLSSFVFSSITYEGNQGQIQGLRYPDPTFGNHLYFSSARVRLDRFSSFITTRSRVYLDVYPTFVFDRLNTGASAYSLFQMSSFLQYGTTRVPGQAQSAVFAQNKVAGFGNLFQQPLKFQFNGTDILGNYASNYNLCHNLISSITSNLAPGFTSQTVDIFYGSTTSLFLTIQNLP
jgi:hypothetical protein